MLLSYAIRLNRKKKKISQRQLAEKIGVTRSYLSCLETGAKRPSIDLLEKICAVFEIPVYILVWDATETLDVPEHKRRVYDSVRPIIDGLNKSFF